MKSPLYACSSCKLAVLVIRDKSGEVRIVRGCDCDATITANAHASMAGVGGVRA